MVTIKFNLRRNAIHTLYHAVEHLYWSQSDLDEVVASRFDDEDHTVEWKDENGHLCFSLAEFTRLPSVYNLKFAILHLIQAAELLLKSYVEKCEPDALFIKPGCKRTIDLRTALNFAVVRNPTLLSPAQHALLLQAKDLRNAIEHYQFTFKANNTRVLCTDFVAICALLAQSLLSVNVVEAFSWDHMRNSPDAVGNYLSTVLSDTTTIGREAARKTGQLWVSSHADEPVFLCLNCGARAVSTRLGVCTGCGVEGDEDLIALLEDFESMERRVAELQANRSGARDPCM